MIFQDFKLQFRHLRSVSSPQWFGVQHDLPSLHLCPWVLLRYTFAWQLTWRQFSFAQQVFNQLPQLYPTKISTHQQYVWQQKVLSYRVFSWIYCEPLITLRLVELELITRMIQLSGLSDQCTTLVSYLHFESYWKLHRPSPFGCENWSASKI